jgi:hypothetical protein
MRTLLTRGSKKSFWPVAIIEPVSAAPPRPVIITSVYDFYD